MVATATSSEAKKTAENPTVDKSWRQIERLTEANAVLQETLLAMENIVNMQDEQGE